MSEAKPVISSEPPPVTDSALSVASDEGAGVSRSRSVTKVSEDQFRPASQA